jgi:hypothetical protein
MKEIKKANDDLRKLVEAGAQTITAKNYIASIRKLHQVIDEAKTKGAASTYLETLAIQGKKAIQSDFIISQTDERQTFIDALNKLKEECISDSEKTFQLNEYRAKNFERKLFAASHEELKQYASEYASGSFKLDDPLMVDILSGALVDRGFDEENSLVRKIAVDQKYDQPWLKTAEGEIYSLRLKLLNGNGSPLFLTDDNKTFSVDYDELFDIYSIDDEGGEL